MKVRTKKREDEDGAGVISVLCPECGLCCNGVLFGDVKLERGDDRVKLGELGLGLHRKGKTFQFAQPCACLQGVLCSIYEDRPQQCRRFECTLLKQVRSGGTTTELALEAIKRARAKVKAVRALLHEAGQKEEDLPLSRRCAKVLAEPMDLAAGEDGIKLRSRLLLAINDLTQILARDFLTPASEASARSR